MERLWADRLPMAMSLRGLSVERADHERGKVFKLHVPSFDIACGARVCLVGRSGSGKTTFLEMLGLLAHPKTVETFDLSPFGDGRLMSVAEALLNNKVSTLSAIRAKTMGFVLQDGGLLPYLTVEGNARLAAELAGRPKGQATNARIAEIAAEIGIGNLLTRFPAQLSGGERQRAAVLRGLAPQPHILIADEPTASLDPETSEEVLGLLVRSAQAFGITVIMASHNAPLVQQFGFQMYRVQTETNGNETIATLHADPTAIVQTGVI